MLSAWAFTIGSGFSFTSSLIFKKLGWSNKEKERTRPPISGVASSAMLLFSSRRTVTGCSFGPADVFIANPLTNPIANERICLTISRLTIMLLRTHCPISVHPFEYAVRLHSRGWSGSRHQPDSASLLQIIAGQLL